MTKMCDCGHEVQSKGCGTGYGIDPNTKRTYCYACCADRDREAMRRTGKNTLYLTRVNGERVVTNWPGSLVLPVWASKMGEHNFTGIREDVWFWFEKTRWYGVRYGSNTELVHCRRVQS